MSTTLSLYLAAFIGPFVQEDAAIIGAITAFVHPQTGMVASGLLILVLMFAGLVISDLWKYWIGWAGRQQKWAHLLAQRPAIDAIGSQILSHTGKALVIARFVPGTRIPTYVASGYFGVPFGQFAFWIIISALAYTCVGIVLLGTVGMVAGQKGLVITGVCLMAAFVVYVGVGIWQKRVARAKLT